MAAICPAGRDCEKAKAGKASPGLRGSKAVWWPKGGISANCTQRNCRRDHGADARQSRTTRRKRRCMGQGDTETSQPAGQMIGDRTPLSAASPVMGFRARRGHRRIHLACGRSGRTVSPGHGPATRRHHTGHQHSAGNHARHQKHL